MGKGLDKFLSILRYNDDLDDDYDDLDDDFEDELNDELDDIPAPVVKKKNFKKDTINVKKETTPTFKKTSKPQNKSVKDVASNSTRNKIVPLKTGAARGEVCVLRPTVFEDSRLISDVLISGRAAVVNLEGIDLELAQRIIDFISGSCYSLAGNIEQISNYIIIVTPESIDISGDRQEFLSTGIRISSFNDHF